MASIAIGEATGDSTGDGGSVVFFFCSLEAEVIALASKLTLFLEGARPQVFTILILIGRKTKRRRGALALRGKDE